eukprot:9461284-Alexandrium_andersonii.AAC.1
MARTAYQRIFEVVAFRERAKTQTDQELFQHWQVNAKFSPDSEELTLNFISCALTVHRHAFR